MYKGKTIFARVDHLAKLGKRSVTGVSKSAGVSEGTLRKMRESDSGGSLDTLSSIAKDLGCSVACLIGETDDPKPAAPLRCVSKDREAQVIDFDLVSSPDTGEGVLTVVEADGKVRYLLASRQLMAMKHLVSEILDDMKLTASS